ncbi:MAG: hypothetical protein IIZ06_05145, partial [Kiritimatiellae bacterium]|nr:hypothetical protein [Kiritimatiellia bacterium]
MRPGARLALWGAAKPSGPTARDYVQDGLVAMWDGIENAGWGQHDASATTWKDLTGNENDLSLWNGSVVTSNSVKNETAACIAQCPIIPNVSALEICMSLALSGNAIICAMNADGYTEGNIFLCIYPDTNNYMQREYKKASTGYDFASNRGTPFTASVSSLSA